MHHKRHRPKSRRAGCLMCKPWKHQRVGKRLRAAGSARRIRDVTDWKRYA